MVRLMIEQMRENVVEWLLMRDAARRAVGDQAPIGFLLEVFDDTDDASILGRSSRGELQPVVVQDRVQPIRMLAFAGEALEPDPVGQEQVVERAWRLEKNTPIGRR